MLFTLWDVIEWLVSIFTVTTCTYDTDEMVVEKLKSYKNGVAHWYLQRVFNYASDAVYFGGFNRKASK